MSGLHGSYGVNAFARGLSLQDCESLCVKFGNRDPGGGDIREGLPPEGKEAVSRRTSRADRSSVHAMGSILGLFWFRFKLQWTGLCFLFLGYHMAAAF